MTTVGHRTCVTARSTDVSWKTFKEASDLREEDTVSMKGKRAR